MILTVSIILCIICFIGGLIYGLLPLRQEQQNRIQKTVVDVDGIAVVACVIILILLGADAASWIAIGCVAVGFGIGYIPPLRQWARSQWNFFDVAPTRKHHTRK